VCAAAAENLAAQRGESDDLLGLTTTYAHVHMFISLLMPLFVPVCVCAAAAENLAAQRGVSDDLLKMVRVESKHFSLPFNIKSQVENSNGMPSMLKVCARAAC
jgi:hypothetical protein